jgi:KaiC/GvpD/RAD55 family RecA-like ATPase
MSPANGDDRKTPQGHAQREGKAPEDSITRCDYCRLPCPGETVPLEADGMTYDFCSDACREAVRDGDKVFTEYHGHRRISTGVSALDVSLPEGIPRNSLVMLTDLAGTRTEAMQAELVWRALQRNEPVVYVSFLEPPVSVVQEFISLSWNVLPSLEQGDFKILDCFTYRVDDRERMYRRMNDWNAHIWDIAEDATVTVRDPTGMGQLQNRLDKALESVGAQDQGLIVIDSLTELGSLVQPVQAYNFLKDVRADVCKGRFVPIFAGATVTGDGEKFPHDLGYMVDGMVEMRLNEDIVEDALVKQLRVRKMSGVLTYPQWQVYEFTAGKGLVTFDPREQLADAESEEAGEAKKEGEDAEAAENKTENEEET